MRRDSDRQKLRVVAICCADLHLGHNPPIARSVEPDWYEAMKRPLHEIEDLQSQNNDCPILCAGDIFDRPNPPPELINFAMAFFPRPYDDVNHPQWFCIPGNHELPNHRYEDMRKSAYYTLVKAGRIINLPPGESLIADGVQVFGFPWGYKLTPPPTKKITRLAIAVAHHYIWQGKKGYPGAPEEKRSDKIEKQLEGFDAAIFGDNHISFARQHDKAKGGINIFNCGSLMRRHVDQRNYKPRVGLLMENGSFQFHYLDTSQDKFINKLKEESIKQRVMEVRGLRELIDEFTDLSTESINFIDSLERLLDQEDTNPFAKSVIQEAIQRVRE